MSLQTAAVASLVSICVLTVSLTLTVRAALGEAYELRVVQTRVLASNLTAALAFGDVKASNDVLSTLENARYTVWARVLLPDGSTLSEYRNSSEIYADDFNRQDPASGFAQDQRIESIQEPVEWQGDTLGQLEVWIDNTTSYDLAQRVFFIAVFAVLFGCLLAYAVALRLAVLVLQPVRNLTDLMQSISSREDYSKRFKGSEIEEIQMLGNSFNIMLSAVEDRDASLKQVISQLEQARDAAQQAADSKTMFLANMSHEIRTPMNGVLGVVSLLKGTELNSRQQKYFDTIEQSASGLLVVIDDILDFTTLEAGRLKIQSNNFRLGETLATIDTFFSGTAEDKGLQFRIVISPEIEDQVTGDAARLRQILLNLVGNALKFTEEGRVELRVEPITGRGDQWLRFSVHDTGVGIAEDKQEGIFSAFFQADFTSTREYGGTGLGLAISRQLANLMEGEVSFHSVEGEGSCFSLELPLPAEILNPFNTTFVNSPRLDQNPFGSAAATAAKTQQLTSESTELISSFESLRVLVAEDSEVNQFIIKELLGTLNVVPQIVSNGEEAVAAFRDKSFDVIFMDIQMPVLDGLGATEKIRELQVHSQLNSSCQIAGLSAHAMAGDREKSLAAGMDEYLTKPIDRERLLQYLKTVQAKSTEQISTWR
jgi:signal transduction histidine kinase/CheY-like chemotaxis protein